MKFLTCNKCGKQVSTAVPDDTVVRGWIECPDCIDETIEQGTTMNKKNCSWCRLEFIPEDTHESTEYPYLLISYENIIRVKKIESVRAYEPGEEGGEAIIYTVHLCPSCTEKFLDLMKTHGDIEIEEYDW